MHVIELRVLKLIIAPSTPRTNMSKTDTCMRRRRQYVQVYIMAMGDTWSYAVCVCGPHAASFVRSLVRSLSASVLRMIAKYSEHPFANCDAVA